jgi:lipid-A-disaccharide synthase
MNKPASRIAIISGELSGDSYAVDLVEQLKSVMPNALFEGISGQRTQAAGLKQWSNCQPKAVMALTQVISNIVHFRRLLDTIKQNLTKCPPDLLILIDYGGLNLRVARIASECRIPVLYYIPPKVWAWGQWRLKKIKRYVKWVAPIYPFESDFFKRHAIESFLIQHPFIEKIRSINPSSQRSRTQHRIALLPGSREQEIRHLLPIMLKSVYLIVQNNSNYRIDVICAEPSKLALIEQITDHWSECIPLSVVTENKLAHLKSCRAALVCSGTASFECAMLTVPMVIMYRANWINYCIGKLLFRAKWFGLPNLILNCLAVPELLQHHCQPKHICNSMIQLLKDGVHRQRQLTHLERLAQQMTERDDCLPIGEVVTKILTHS